MLLNVTQYNSKLLSHSASRKILMGEVSDLQLNRFERLYDDAYDVGIALRNTETGNVTRWHLVDTLVDPEGDILEWQLKPTPDTVYRNPAIAGYLLRLIND